MSHLPRLALLSDFREENWISMEFCAEMLEINLQKNHASELGPFRYAPPWKRIFTGLPILRRKHSSLNADRLFNRFVFYPRYLRKLQADFDLFHVVDHSYAHLVHYLPGARTGVFCHDLDAFRSVIDPLSEPRPGWYRKMARHLLTGMQKAAIVFYTTNEVRRQIDRYQVVDPDLLVQAPLGTAAEYTPDTPEGYQPPPQTLIEQPFILHVGSCVPRKRIDVLLKTFAELRGSHPDLLLVKIGGQFSPEHRELIQKYRLAPFIRHLVGVEREVVAEMYRRARAILQPSEAEGFGLPVIEALSCGAAVVATELPVLREVGGDAVLYAGLADIPNWVEQVTRVLDNKDGVPDRTRRLAQAAKYTWQTHAKIICDAYKRLA